MDRMEVKLRDFKFAEEGGAMALEGYGAVFGNVDSYGDVIAPGAFAKSLAAHKEAGTMPQMLLEHGWSASPLPVGKWEQMSEDGHGLIVKGRILPTTEGKDTYIALKEGAVDGLSIGFRPTEFSLRQKPEEPRRTLKSVDLVEVSIVGRPANSKARIAQVKSADALKSEIKRLSDLSDFLREVGRLSKSEAEAVCSNFRAKADRSESEEADAVADALRRNITLLTPKG